PPRRGGTRARGIHASGSAGAHPEKRIAGGRRPRSGTPRRGMTALRSIRFGRQTMTMRPLRILVIVAAVALANPAGRAQQPAPQRTTETAKSGVTAVLVDVIVRDRRGQPVRDLDLSEFQVFEDGVPQNIGSFTRVFDGSVRATSPVPTAMAAAPPAGIGSSAPIGAGPGVTALVFDRLSPDARQLAVRAAQESLGGDERTADYVGVFGIDLALTTYAPFTRSREALRQALDKIGSRSSASFNSPDPQSQRAAADQRAAT